MLRLLLFKMISSSFNSIYKSYIISKTDYAWLLFLEDHNYISDNIISFLLVSINFDWNKFLITEIISVKIFLFVILKR